jgi:hypothetical protein
LTCRSQYLDSPSAWRDRRGIIDLWKYWKILRSTNHSASSRSSHANIVNEFGIQSRSPSFKESRKGACTPMTNLRTTTVQLTAVCSGSGMETMHKYFEHIQVDGLHMRSAMYTEILFFWGQWSGGVISYVVYILHFMEGKIQTLQLRKQYPEQQYVEERYQNTHRSPMMSQSCRRAVDLAKAPLPVLANSDGLETAVGGAGVCQRL